MAQDHMVFRGVFPNHTLFKNCVDTWTQAQGFPLSSRYVKFAEAMGVGSHVIQRVIYGDTDSRKAGETLRLSIPLAQKAEDLLEQPRGTFGGLEPSEFPQEGLQPVQEAPAPPPAPEAPTATQSKVHIVLGVTGADLDDPPQHDAVETGFYLIPLDKLGEWGKALMRLLHPYLRDKAIANQIPILVEESTTFNTMVLTVPVPHGERKTTTLSSSIVAPLLKGCAKLTGQEAIFAITELFTGLIAAQRQEVETKTLAKATMKDQLASIRQHIGDLQALVESMGPLGTSLRDVEHDVTRLIGCDDPVANDLLDLLDRYDTMRQEFRSLLRLIQADPAVAKKSV